MNNPLRYTDPDGRTEKERNKAISRAKEYVSANPNKDKALYGYAGYHKGTPGRPIDCSGLVSDCSKATGKGFLNSGNAKTGVLNVVNNCNRVSLSEARPGDLLTFNNNKHVGIISSVKYDDKGNITEMKMIHASSSRGPVEDKINDYYMSIMDTTPVLQWDTPETYVADFPAIEVTAKKEEKKESTDENTNSTKNEADSDEE